MTTDIAFLVDFLLSEKGLCGQTYLLILLNIADDKYRVGVVATNNLINLNIIALDLRPRRVPAHYALFGINAAHHVEHLLVVDVIKEPDVGLMCVLFKRHRIAISDVEHLVVGVLAEENTDDALGGTRGYSVVVVNDGEENGRVHYDHFGLLVLHSLEQCVSHIFRV